MAKNIRRILAMVLVMVMFASALPMQALAVETVHTTETSPENLTTDVYTTIDDEGNETIVVKITKGEYTDENGNVITVDREETIDMTGREPVSSGTETKEWVEEDTGDEPGQPEVEVTLTPGETTTGTAEESTTVTDETGTTTTTTTDRTVTAETSDVKVTVNVTSTGLVGEQDTALTPLVPVYDEVDGEKEDKVGVNDGEFKKLLFTQDPSTWEVPDGGEYRYVGYGEDGKYYVATVQVYYEKDESGNTVYDENGNPIIADIRTVSGTNVTIQGEDAFTLDAGHQLSPYNGSLPGTLQLMDKEGNSVFAYCCDEETRTVNGYWYSVSNLEDSDYYASEDAENHIRSIALNGYWGTSDTPKEDGTYETGSLENIKAKLKAAIANGEIDGVFEMTCFTENGKVAYDENGNVVTQMVNMLDIIDGLTAGEALTATQAAIWSYSNGNQNALNGTDGSVVVAPDYRANHKASNSDALDNHGGARIEFLYNWLMNLESDAETTVVINEKNFVEDVSLTVGDKVADHTANQDDNSDNDVYNADLNFRLAFIPGDKDDLLVQIKYTDLDGKEVTVVKRLAGTNSEGQSYEDIKPEADGSYVLRGLKLSENEDFDFDLRLEGTQYLEQAVYVYSPIGGRGSSQTAVGVAEGTREVDVSLGMTIKFDVDENNHVVAERKWQDEIDPPEEEDPPVEEEDPPVIYRLDPETEEEIPEEPVPLAAPVVTGSNSYLWILVVMMAILGMAVINLTSKKNYAA